MDDMLVYALEQLAAGISIVLMGLCAAQLLARFARVLRGREMADGISSARRFAPGSHLLAAAPQWMQPRCSIRCGDDRILNLRDSGRKHPAPDKSPAIPPCRSSRTPNQLQRNSLDTKCSSCYAHQTHWHALGGYRHFRRTGFSRGTPGMHRGIRPNQKTKNRHNCGNHARLWNHRPHL